MMKKVQNILMQYLNCIGRNYLAQEETNRKPGEAEKSNCIMQHIQNLFHVQVSHCTSDSNQVEFGILQGRHSNSFPPFLSTIESGLLQRTTPHIAVVTTPSTHHPYNLNV